MRKTEAGFELKPRNWLEAQAGRGRTHWRPATNMPAPVAWINPRCVTCPFRRMVWPAP